MDVVGDILARDRRSRDTALVTPDGRERTYRDLITNAHKAANVLRYLGAREGSTVAVSPAPGLHAILGFLGAAGIGAPVRFDPAAGIERGDRVVLVDVADEATTEPAPGTSLAVFGGAPARPETTHWEQELWSENPGMPPSGIGPDDPVLRGGWRDEPDGGGTAQAGAVTAQAGAVTAQAGAMTPRTGTATSPTGRCSTRRRRSSTSTDSDRTTRSFSAAISPTRVRWPPASSHRSRRGRRPSSRARRRETARRPSRVTTSRPWP